MANVTYTFSPNTRILSSEVNQNYTDLENQKINPISFSAYLSANTSVDNNDTIICNTEVWDNGGNYNNATGIFTAPVAGEYIFYFSVSYNPVVDQNRYGGYLTGSSIGLFLQAYLPMSGTSQPFLPASKNVRLSASETVTFKVNEDAAGSPSLQGGSTEKTSFGGHLFARD